MSFQWFFNQFFTHGLKYKGDRSTLLHFIVFFEGQLQLAYILLTLIWSGHFAEEIKL